jgi:hypothetical protein
MSEDSFFLLCHNDRLGGLRATEERLVVFLRQALSPTAYPVWPDMQGWSDLATRRGGMLLDLVVRWRADGLRGQWNDPLRDCREHLDARQAFQGPWYYGDRSAPQLMDDLAALWGLTLGLHYARLRQGVRTGVV